ncbi:uncharacterized protein LOC34621085 [Cyclospora cayetanensis]|uniref:2Fe-2S ferredoxin n=1 Tax=Cyclospora cayetanensis TaxID=88456 RepID=A0A6P6RYE1_9EIME|nr:uncharacterized protein LOC34621085 [Cyclospora cayetanensis]
MKDSATRTESRFDFDAAQCISNPKPAIVRISHWWSLEGCVRRSFAFVEDDGKETAVQVPEGTTILEAAHSNDVPLEGSCEGQCSCSTCHVILSDELYEALPEPSVEEEDMLDLAACLTDTSRLGCQIRVNKHFEGEKIKLPAITRNFFVDGHKPSPH